MTRDEARRLGKFMAAVVVPQWIAWAVLLAAWKLWMEHPLHGANERLERVETSMREIASVYSETSRDLRDDIDVATGMLAALRADMRDVVCTMHLVAATQPGRARLPRGLEQRLQPTWQECARVWGPAPVKSYGGP